jgi:hypothetical protein
MYTQPSIVGTTNAGFKIIRQVPARSKSRDVVVGLKERTGEYAIWYYTKADGFFSGTYVRSESAMEKSMKERVKEGSSQRDVLIRMAYKDPNLREKILPVLASSDRVSSKKLNLNHPWERILRDCFHTTTATILDNIKKRFRQHGVRSYGPTQLEIIFGDQKKNLFITITENKPPTTFHVVVEPDRAAGSPRKWDVNPRHSLAAIIEDIAQAVFALMAQQGKDASSPLRSRRDHDSRFEEGKPADPTENMSEEDAEKWEEMNEKHRDKFK